MFALNMTEKIQWSRLRSFSPLNLILISSLFGIHRKFSIYLFKYNESILKWNPSVIIFHFSRFIFYLSWLDGWLKICQFWEHFVFTIYNSKFSVFFRSGYGMKSIIVNQDEIQALFECVYNKADDQRLTSVLKWSKS